MLFFPLHRKKQKVVILMLSGLRYPDLQQSRTILKKKFLTGKMYGNVPCPMLGEQRGGHPPATLSCFRLLVCDVCVTPVVSVLLSVQTAARQAKSGERRNQFCGYQR